MLLILTTLPHFLSIIPIRNNRYYSLTAIKDIDSILDYHVLDGLTLVDNIRIKQYLCSNILDIGSGMGVPSVILAICMPNSKVVALDCNSKKTTFLRQVAIELELKNLNVIHARIEEYQPSTKFAIITARAFASINKLFGLSKHLLLDNGCYLLMKSKKTYEELDNTLDNVDSQVFVAKIPKLEDVRYIVKLNFKQKG